MIQQAIKNLIEGKTMPRDEAYRAIMDIMKGEATPAQIGGFITAVRMHGETPEIIAGAAQAMRENMVKIRCDDPNAVDIVGTGGDGAHTFNISTAAAFVTAGAGVTVAKHGSYGVSSKCGAANVLSELGINLQYSPQKMEECLETLGIAFLFAPTLHPAMKYAASTSNSRIRSARSASRVPKINRWFFGKLSTLSSSQLAVSCHFTSKTGSLC